MAYGAYASLDVESGILNFSLYRVSHTSIHAPLILETDGPQSSNSTKAYEEASKVIKGLVDGSVRPLFLSQKIRIITLWLGRLSLIRQFLMPQRALLSTV